jgi:hypothetical protein
MTLSYITNILPTKSVLTDVIKNLFVLAVKDVHSQDIISVALIYDPIRLYYFIKLIMMLSASYINISDKNNVFGLYKMMLNRLAIDDGYKKR